VTEGAKTTLLIVDDEKPIRDLLAHVAQRAGFETDTARDGIDALAKLAQREYAIVIVDLMMPRLSGYELVQKISALVPRPTVIVATALTDGDIANLDDSMVRRVIRKPFDINSVASALIETAQQIAEAKGPLPPSAAAPGTRVINGDVPGSDTPPPPAPKKRA
jgi:DNA-binding response OmpR family regulator